METKTVEMQEVGKRIILEEDRVTQELREIFISVRSNPETMKKVKKFLDEC